MKRKAAPGADPSAGSPEVSSARTRHARIHPVIVYPFRQPSDYSDLKELYRFVERLDARKGTYARPITVMDRKTGLGRDTDSEFVAFRTRVSECSDLVDAWCVDTCQMWYTGLGMAYERGTTGDVHWLIPGDFNYGSAMGQEVLSRLHDLPEICIELGQDMCIGEIATDQNNSKQMIDTYGTFSLLYNWFPREAREIRQYTERPRSEFFAMHHCFLGELLQRRWYAYEQTVVALLHAVFGNRRICRFFVGHVTDLPEGRETLASALQQIERTERVLKSMWRERREGNPNWVAEYRVLEVQSEQIRRTATTILEQMLEPNS